MSMAIYLRSQIGVFIWIRIIVNYELGENIKSEAKRYNSGIPFLILLNFFKCKIVFLKNW